MVAGITSIGRAAEEGRAITVVSQCCQPTGLGGCGNGQFRAQIIHIVSRYIIGINTTRRGRRDFGTGKRWGIVVSGNIHRGGDNVGIGGAIVHFVSERITTSGIGIGSIGEITIRRVSEIGTPFATVGHYAVG